MPKKICLPKLSLSTLFLHPIRNEQELFKYTIIGPFFNQLYVHLSTSATGVWALSAANIYQTLPLNAYNSMNHIPSSRYKNSRNIFLRKSGTFQIAKFLSNQLTEICRNRQAEEQNAFLEYLKSQILALCVYILFKLFR